MDITKSQKEQLEDIYNKLEKELDKELIIKIILFLIVILILVLPKIYIANNIYNYSVKINKLLHEYYFLKTENFILHSNIEKIKLQNRLNQIELSKKIK